MKRKVSNLLRNFGGAAFKMAWIAKAYNESFDFRDEDDKASAVRVEKADPDQMTNVIKSTIVIINTTKQSMQEWARYKYDLLNWEKNHIEIFKWIPQMNKLPGSPYVGMDIDWSKLKDLNRVDRCRVCLLLSFALSNAWFNDRRFPSIWEVVDPDRESTGTSYPKD